MDDKEYNFTSKINELDFNDKSTLNDINIDSIIASYATKKVQNYLKEENLNEYIISEDGNIAAGNYYEKGKYSISIHNSEGKLIDIAYIENESLVTKGNVNTFKPYMVNPKIGKKQEENKMVVVIAKDINEANMIASALYLLDVNEGKEFIKDYNAQALWVENDGKQTMTDKFKQYLK